MRRQDKKILKMKKLKLIRLPFKQILLNKVFLLRLGKSMKVEKLTIQDGFSDS